MTEIALVLCTVPEAAARELGDRLLEERLVACVSCVGPLSSRYRWQGVIESAEETLLLLKTTAARIPALRERITALHPYDVPEVLELAVSGGAADYLAWVAQSCAG